MTLSDELFENLTKIYNAVYRYDNSRENKENIVDITAHLLYTILTLDNPETEFDYMEICKLCEMRFELAIAGGNPFDLQNNKVVKKKEKEPVRERSETFKAFDKKLDDFKRKHGLDF